METDITEVLGSIRVPTLVLHPQEQGWRDVARYVADRIPQAVVVELGSSGRWLYTNEVAEALLSFLRGDSTAARSRLGAGDRALHRSRGLDRERGRARGQCWRELLERHHATRSERAREVPGNRGRHCRRRVLLPLRRSRSSDRMAGGIVEGATELGPPGACGDPHRRVPIRRRKDRRDLRGHRISHLALAGPGEVLVSSTVKDLVAGSGFAFTDRGEHELKGVPGVWRLRRHLRRARLLTAFPARRSVAWPQATGWSTDTPRYSSFAEPPSGLGSVRRPFSHIGASSRRSPLCIRGLRMHFPCPRSRWVTCWERRFAHLVHGHIAARQAPFARVSHACGGLFGVVGHGVSGSLQIAWQGSHTSARAPPACVLRRSSARSSSSARATACSRRPSPGG